MPGTLQVSGMDKAAHLVSYGAIAASFLLAIGLQNARRLWMGLLAGLIILAAADELTQPFFGRIADIMDFAANLVGAVLVYILFEAYAYLSQKIAMSTSSYTLPTAHDLEPSGRSGVSRNENARRRLIVAAAVAAFIMLGTGLSYRSISTGLAVPATANPLAPESLDELPMEINDWIGQDVVMDDAVVEATDTDAHLNRQYWRKSDLKSISLFAGCSFRALYNVIHRPEYCYPRSGWTLTDRYVRELTLGEGKILPCTIYHFSRGSLEVEHVVVLHYLVADGEYYSDVPVLESRLWHIFSSIDYVARVMISTSGRISRDEAGEETVCEFAKDSATALAHLFNDVQRQANSASLAE